MNLGDLPLRPGERFTLTLIDEGEHAGQYTASIYQPRYESASNNYGSAQSWHEQVAFARASDPVAATTAALMKLGRDFATTSATPVQCATGDGGHDAILATLGDIP